MKRRLTKASSSSAPRKNKIKASSAARRKASSSPGKIKASSSATAPSSKTLTRPSLKSLSEGEKTYSITDMLSIYNLSASDMEEELKSVGETPTVLKDIRLEPDRDIMAILEQSKTLKSQTTSPSTTTTTTTQKGRPLMFRGTTSVVGKLIYREDGIDVSCHCWSLIPRNINPIESMTNTGALFILLVANDSVIWMLDRKLFYQRFPCIIVSADGPPDFLLKMDKELNLPVLALLDLDPRSLKILAFYGSRLSNIKWLGLRPSDVAGHLDPRELTLRMTRKDINTAIILLNDSYIKTRPQWRKELSIMLRIQRKMEVQFLSCLGMLDYLIDVLLPMKLQLEDWI